MNKTIKIRCKNNKKTLNFPIGSTLSEIFPAFGLEMPYGPTSAKVNNKVVGMDFTVFHDKDVEFLDITDASGHRAYTRTLFFVLCKAVHDLYPSSEVMIDIPVSNGYYCDLNIGHTLTTEDVDAIRRRMQEIIAAAHVINRHECPTDEAIRIFEQHGTNSKAKLLRTTGRLYTTYYDIDGYADHYYGALLVNTRQLHLFDVVKYYDGILLRLPLRNDPTVLGELIRQDKMFGIFQEHHRWQDILGMTTVGDFNEAVKAGHATDIVNVSEALQEKKIAHIAEQIANREGVRVVLIAGPSSSGKTTSSKRLAIQLLTNCIMPKVIELDNYFVNREHTPRDKDGDYDYESLYALDLEQFNKDVTDLLAGKEVAMPTYNFKKGEREYLGNTLKLAQGDILLMEGIHGLNPELTRLIPEDQKFRLFVSALTTLNIDDHNWIGTYDNRMLRRIIRDHQYRGASALDTIKRWASVRRGEEKWIMPFHENADAMFNSSLLFELSVIKNYALPILQQVPSNTPEYAEASRLIKFLSYFEPLDEKDIPSTSLLREFLGGSSFHY